MFLYENEKCPVCDKAFAEGDDVVVCPQCATPHHRECYNELGHCVNKDKHKQGFEFKKGECVADASISAQSMPDENIADVNTHSAQESTSYVQAKSTKTTCTKCGTQINKSAPFCYNCGHKQENPDYGAKVRLGSAVVYDDNDETIDNYRVRDMVAVIKSNTQRFIGKFRSGRKVSWNWGAFFFGPYYLFFRKMNLQGIVALVVNAISYFVVSGLYIEQITEFSQIYGKIINIASQKSEDAASRMAQISPQLAQEFWDAVYKVTPAVLILIALMLAVNIVIALIADNLYKKKVYQLISKCDEKSKDMSIPVSFNISLGDDDMDMNDEKNRATYLSFVGGVSVFAPVIAYCAYSFVMQLISR